MPARLPVAVAKRVAEAHDLQQVILLAFDGKLTHVVTYGKSVEDCDQAAQGGDKLKAALGWTDTAPALPSRVKRLTAENQSLRDENKGLREANERLVAAVREARE